MKFVCTCADLKQIIRDQIDDEITSDDHDVGYTEGSTVVRIRSQEDLLELWASIVKDPTKKQVWCDGLVDHLTGPFGGTKRRNKKDDLEDGDISSKKKKLQTNREDKVQETVDKLKEKHGSDFTPMQYRIWSEMYVGDMHASTDDPPSTSMFSRASTGATPYRKKGQQPSITQVVTEAATAFTSALSKPTIPVTPVSVGVTTSPAKVIECRSKLYKQLADLQNLRGMMTEEEYSVEKESIKDFLKQLRSIILIDYAKHKYDHCQ